MPKTGTEPKPDRNARRAAGTDAAREALKVMETETAQSRVQSDGSAPVASPPPAREERVPQDAAPAPQTDPNTGFDFKAEYEKLPDNLKAEINNRFKSVQRAAAEAREKEITERNAAEYGKYYPLLEEAKTDKALRESLELLVTDKEFRDAYLKIAPEKEIRELLQDKDMREFLFRDAAAVYKPQIEEKRKANPAQPVDERYSKLERELADMRAAQQAREAQAAEAQREAEYNSYRQREVAALLNEGAEELRWDTQSPNAALSAGYALTQHLVTIAHDRSVKTGQFVPLKAIYDEYRAAQAARKDLPQAAPTNPGLASGNGEKKPAPPQAPMSAAERRNSAIKLLREGGGVDAFAESLAKKG